MQLRLQPYVLRYLIILFLFSIVPIPSRAQDSTGQDIIVKIEPNCTIRFAELQTYVSDSYYNILYRYNRIEAYKKGLDEMIIRQLKLLDFFDLGLNKNRPLLQRIQRTINEELAIEYFRTVFYQKHVNDKSMHDAYKKMWKEVFYRQIILTKPEKASKKSIDSLKNVAIKIRTEAEQGEDFSKLARHYSLNGYSNDEIPPINWKESLSNPSDFIIFNLAEGKVRILETNQAVRIVKVTRIYMREVQPFEAVKDDILKTLDARYLDFSVKEFESAKKNLINENLLQWNTKALNKLVAWSNIPNFYENKYKDTLQLALLSGNNFLILKYSKAKVDLKEYLRLLDNVLLFGKSSSVKADDLKKFILEAVRTDMIIQKANTLNLERNIFNPQTTNPVLRTEIIRLYDQEVIETQIPKPTETALKQFYQENKDSLFYQLAKVNIYAIIDSSKKTIDELNQKLNQNVPFKKLVDLIYVKAFILDRNGNIKSYLSRERPFLGEAAFKLKLSETAGPIEYDDPEKGKQYALIQCIERREEKQLSYQNVEKTITDEFIKFYSGRYTTDTQKHLLNKYTVTLYKDELSKKLSSIGIDSQ